MHKITFEVGLAIGGMASTIVLLVLDKAGKLKGPVLLVLLAVAGAMFVPLALKCSDNFPDTWKVWGRTALVGIVGLVFWGLGIWITPTPPQPPPPKILTAVLEPSYKVMPSDPPYAKGTTIAGVKFEPRMLDVRLFLRAEHGTVKNSDVFVRLVNMSGQMLTIDALAQVTQIPRVTILPVGTPPVLSITAIGPDGPTTIPMGATGPFGTLTTKYALWRIHADEILDGSQLEFFLMVSRPYVNKPYRTRMIQGFFTTVVMPTEIDGKPKHHIQEQVLMFDDRGQNREVTSEELENIGSRYSLIRKPS